MRLPKRSIKTIQVVKELPKRGSTIKLYSLQKDMYKVLWEWDEDEQKWYEYSFGTDGNVSSISVDVNNSVVTIVDLEGDSVAFNVDFSDFITDTYNTVRPSTLGKSLGSNSDISSQLNSATLFRVHPEDNPIFKHSYISNIEGQGFRLLTDYYLLLRGAGSYGLASGETLTPNDFFLIRSVSSQTTINSNQPPIVENLQGDVNQPSVVVNTSINTFSITLESDYYFIITNQNQEKLYRFVGLAGEYGAGGDTTQSTDFILVEDLSSDTPQTQRDNVSKTLKVNMTDLNGIGTLEQQLVEYINSLNYNKTDIEDLFIEIVEVEINNAFDGMLTIS